jgi:acetolactate synthase-1/2/3 large subunit
VVRKAFKLAQQEKMGASFIEFPENVAEMEISDAPLRPVPATTPEPAADRVQAAAEVISEARNPIILGGNGVIRAKAWLQLADFAGRLHIPLANTFMAKGVIPFRHPMALGSVGLQAKDYVNCGFDRADVVICVGYDLVEYHPHLWHPSRDRRLIHIDTLPPEVDGSYEVSVSVVGDIKHSLLRIGELATPQQGHKMRPLRQALVDEMNQHSRDESFPVRPQKIIWDLRTALDLEGIVVCDVGAHKLWMARMFRCEHPNTCIISNGFASMGIALAGAVAAKLARPEQAVVAVTGDGGFLMNVQELETAVRLDLPLVVLIWHDGGYGLIEWKQMQLFGRTSHVRFSNPDFIRLAESFGAKGYRVERVADLLPVLKRAMDDPGVAVIDCPVDYSEKAKLTARLGEMACPL